MRYEPHTFDADAAGDTDPDEIAQFLAAAGGDTTPGGGALMDAMVRTGPDDEAVPAAEHDTAEDLAALREVETELDRRWPETRIAPSLDRIRALCDVLGEPQRSYPVVHVAGTNGKSSVTRMIDALLTRIGPRTGRYTSPHLQLVTERIALDGRPISARRYVETWQEIAPYVGVVDRARDAVDGVHCSKFEVLTAMAFAAFADAPVDVGVIETGLGGSWDATNVADAAVAAITPIGLDHQEYLGSDILDIAREKAGIIKPGSVALLAQQTPEVAQVLLERAVEVDAEVARSGVEFGVLERSVAVGGQQLRLQGLGGEYDDIYLPLFGEHQAGNAALALAAVEAFFGAGSSRRLDLEAVRDAFAAVRVPGRLERLRSAPTVVVDAAHNPHGAAAAAAAVKAEFSFRRLVGVVAIMADKDADGILAALEPIFDEVVVTGMSSPRAMDPDQLGALAVARFGSERVVVETRMDAALETAISMSEETSDDGAAAGGGVLVIGSVVAAGEARTLLGREPA
ncbi:folylpolyglutamate synthase/dihydrofolate synthase family protein [Actinomycetospora corticicola]|uniref:Dihydrofolate synthase/folylpolyglutamate synthase n=1 Tax=Actinomycetospora corticicola TaxID=663602 RepID=A0A7Y9J3T6_9PSEU|nr:folylpolyglutamate synthase/dihydrofolate synthase family protein [Actinomycetospora corticicola]NYD33984.1 dihydrofolate synthase/folylpolyglutamate synthase [Actinomycetospora corticicola]